MSATLDKILEEIEELSDEDQERLRKRLAETSIGSVPETEEHWNGALQDQELEHEFNQLVEQWRRETAHLSLVFRQAMHPAYQRIIGMGEKVIPLILREMKENGDHWFWALKAITGKDVARLSDTYREAARSWLAWGKEQGYL